MNLILHQIKTDVRHFRWQLILLWLAFAVDLALMLTSSLSAECRGILQMLLVVWQIFNAVLLIAALVLLAAVLAALTRDLARFFLAVGIAVGGMFAWLVAVDVMKRGRIIDQASAGWNEHASFNASVLTVAYVVLIVGAVLAWIAQARMRWWRAGVIGMALGLMAFPLIETCWRFNFLRPRVSQSVPLAVSMWTENSRTNASPDQLLSTELVVNGVPAEHVAVVQAASVSIKFDGERTGRRTWLPSWFASDSSGRQHPAESGQRDDYFRIIQKFFPAQTLWFNDNFQNGVTSAFAGIYNEEVMKRFTNRPPAGSLSGSVELDLFAVKKIAEVPLQRATFNTLPGQRVTIHNVKITEGVITVPVSESTASLMWNRDLKSIGGNIANYESQPVCTYVLYHPCSGEALLVRQDSTDLAFPALVDDETHLFFKLNFPYPALRERFVGVTTAEWLREARLWVFAPVYAGTTKQDFKQEHYQWTSANLYQRDDKASLAGFAAIEHATLPANPTDAQINSYLDEILLNVPDDLRSEQREVISKKLAAIGTNGLPLLLLHLPVSEHLENNLVLPVITKLVTREHLPELCAALQRDNEVIQVFRMKHWEADARPVVLVKWSDHRAALPAEVLRVAAEAKDPATYADLWWHFLNLQQGHEQVLPALEQCPGFDTAAVVREAWTRARLGVISTSDLAVAAAQQGLPDALSLAVISLEGSREESRRSRELTRLAALTGYAGPATNTLVWMNAHLEQFNFDAAQQRYVLSLMR